MATESKREASSASRRQQSQPPCFHSYAYRLIEKGQGSDAEVVIRCEVHCGKQIDIALPANLANHIGMDLVDLGVKRGDLATA